MFKKQALGFGFWVMGFVLIAGIIGCATVGKSAAARRMAREDANTWDFGTLKEGTQAKHTFILTNETKKPLNITSVNTSCGCTVSEADKRLLAPGESTQITATFNSKGYSGTVRQYIYIGTDNPQEAIIKFVITAEVIE